MSSKFEVDFSEALRQLAEFNLRMNNLGHALDKMETQSGKPATAAKRLLKDVGDHFDKLERKLKAAGASTEDLGKITQSVRSSTASMLSKIAAENLRLTVQTKAYSGSLREVERLLADSSQKSAFLKWAERSRSLGAEMVNQNKYLLTSLQHLDSAEARHNEVLKASIAAKKAMLTADLRQQAESRKLSEVEDSLSSSVGRGLVARRARIEAVKAEIAEDTKLNTALKTARRAYDGLNGGIQGQIALQQAMNQGVAAGITFRQREQNQVDELRRRHESLNGGLAEQAAQLRVLNSAREKEITELTRERAKLEELARTLASLNGGEQEQLARLQAKIAARRRQIQEDTQSVAVTEQLTQAAAKEMVAEQRLKDALDARNRATMEQARALQGMTKAEAEALAKTEALAAANKRHSDALLDEARKAHGMSRAQLELSNARERELEKLSRLKAQKDMLNSAYGRELAAVQSQIAEQQRYNRLLTMSTAELLGFTRAQTAANVSMQVGSQSAAAMRAALAGLHSNIGMYTSSTIIAASSTYALASAIRSTVQIGADFTASLARTDAIMNGSEPFWMVDTGAMKAMEGQVRALGESTVYTASEVAEGLGQLGMAGLSAGDAVVSLRPALDLATIGNINMGQSADIATNVMMTFGLQAKDLTDVVDVMATAVVQSNTDITELANALTYAGPAAHTAGISMRDTVAAVEALANSGIKASRSGTALRRLFVSILNPTEKGAAMMEKYGISVVDAEGKTRGLVDIVQRLSGALDGLSGAERLGAIQDLVGVYATSPIAALVDQSENLVELRRNLDDVAGAAERMQKKISDNLKHDWKAVISAFEEVKLTAFDAVEMRLRTASAQLARYLTDLTAPLKDGDSLTKLDVMLAQAENTATALAQVVGGVLAFKLISGSTSAALANDAKLLAEKMTILSARAAATGTSMQGMALQTNGASAAMRVQAGVAASAAAGLTTMTGAAAAASRAVAGIATVASGLLRFLGWAGLIYGIGSALYTVFSSDHEEAARAQKDRVDDLKKSYDELKGSLMETALAKEREALAGQIRSEESKIDQSLKRKAALPELIEEGKSLGLPVNLLEAEYANIDRQVDRYRTNIANTKKQLEGLKATEVDRISLLEKQQQGILDVKKAQEDYNRAVEEAGRGNNVSQAAIDKVNAMAEALRNAREAAKGTAEEAKKVSNNMATLADLAAADFAKAQSDQSAALEEKQATDAEKLLRLKREQATVQAAITKLTEQDATALATGGDRPGQDELNRLLERRKKILEDQTDLLASQEQQEEELLEAKKALADFGRSEEQQLANLKAQLASVMELKRDNEALKGTSHEGLYAERETERLAEELRLRQQIKQIEGSQARASAKSSGGGGDKSLKAALEAYKALEKQFDPVARSSEELSQKTAQMNLLLERGEISADGHAKALAALGKAHKEVVLQQDKNYQSLQKLRSEYEKSPFASTLDDLVELNRLYKEGAISIKEYGRVSAEIKKKSREEALNGQPTAATRLQDSGSTPFGEWASAEIERAQGMAWYGTRQKDLASGYANTQDSINNKYNKLQEDLNNEALSREAHAARLIQIEDEKNQALLAAQRQFADQSAAVDSARAQYSEQMGKMAMIATLNSAESIMGQFASVAEGATTAQKAAFVAQKALAIAQILMYTHLAAAQAMAIPGDPMKVMGIPLASFITAQGYASAALVGALAIGQLTSGGSSGSGGSYAGAFDKGGQIPYGQWGIVGEYGPEIVHGPANVTGREATARKLGGGGDEYHVTLAPQIVVEYSGDGGGSTSVEEQGRALGEVVKRQVLGVLVEQTRPNGVLDTWIRNRRG